MAAYFRLCTKHITTLVVVKEGVREGGAICDKEEKAACIFYWSVPKRESGAVLYEVVSS